VCSSGRWKGERGLCFAGNRVYLLLTVEVQSRSEQRLLVPVIHFSKPLVFFKIYFYFRLYLIFFIVVCFFLYDFFVFLFTFKGGRALGGWSVLLFSPYLFLI